MLNCTQRAPSRCQEGKRKRATQWPPPVSSLVWTVERCITLLLQATTEAAVASPAVPCSSTQVLLRPNCKVQKIPCFSYTTVEILTETVPIKNVNILYILFYIWLYILNIKQVMILWNSMHSRLNNLEIYKVGKKKWDFLQTRQS